MFCCDGLRNLISLAGERGNAILAYERASGEIGFVHQSRGIAFEDIPKLKPIPIDITINIDAVVGVRYCAACGCKMDDLVRKAPDFFKQLAKDHRKFLAATPGFEDLVTK